MSRAKLVVVPGVEVPAVIPLKSLGIRIEQRGQDWIVCVSGVGEHFLLLRDRRPRACCVDTPPCYLIVGQVLWCGACLTPQ
ncbi:MAG: hypothetical protein ACRDQV_05850 [Pseudonocardiaceae bacterium]